MTTIPIKDNRGSLIGTATLVQGKWLVEIGSDLLYLKDPGDLRGLDMRCNDRRFAAALEQMKQFIAERGGYDSLVSGADKFGKWVSGVVHPEDVSSFTPAISELSKASSHNFAPIFVLATLLFLRNPSRLKQLFR